MYSIGDKVRILANGKIGTIKNSVMLNRFHIQCHIVTDDGEEYCFIEDMNLNPKYLESYEEENNMEKPKTISFDENSLNTQVVGDHYSKLKIQPMEYSMANGLDACQHTAIKYITRFRDKGGKEDLLKAIHTINMLIEFEYGDGKSEAENKSV